MLSTDIHCSKIALCINCIQPRFIEEDCEDDSIISEEDSRQPVDQICRKTVPETYFKIFKNRLASLE